MNNRQLNAIYPGAKQDAQNSIDKLRALLNCEKFLLDEYERGQRKMDAHHRNSKGEYINISQMKRNIEQLETCISQMQSALSNLTISSSVYL